jgi:protein SCO1
MVMDKSNRRIAWLISISLLLAVVAIVAAYSAAQFRRFAASDISLPMASPLPDFTLTNQNGRPVTLADLRGQVWVADIIFTSCAGPCPIMTKQMSELQGALPAGSAVRLMSLTTHPEVDTPEVLRGYGQRFQADFNRWMFLTGSKEQIARLAREGLKLAAQEKPPEERAAPEDLFIHSTLFVIVDQNGRLRGSFESDDPEWKRKIVAAVRKLLREGERKT